jgi:hypothetical protein
MYLGKVLFSEVFQYVNEDGIHCTIDVFFLENEIRAYASSLVTDDEEIIGLGIHENNKYQAVELALHDLFVQNNVNVN